MNSAELLRFVKSVPFSPFEIHLSNGTVHTISHPECLVVGKTTSLIVYPSNEPGLFEDEWSRFANLHVNEIRVPSAVR